MAQRAELPTTIGSFRLTMARDSIARDEFTEAKISFRVEGALRELFSPDVWLQGYDAGDRQLKIRYSASMERRGLLRLSDPALPRQRFSRKATFYWSRDPDLPYRIWGMIVDENGEPRLPKTVEDARHLLFDVEKSFTILGSDIGPGEHRLVAKARVKWFKHTFTEKGSVQATSPVVNLRCL